MPDDDEHRAPAETDEERAERIAREVAADNPDPITRREAIEQELAEEGLSDEGTELGQHND
ncbi:MAG TPA: hypothetical protein VFZ79_06575 [Acidimicrobiales bacterium]